MLCVGAVLTDQVVGIVESAVDEDGVSFVLVACDEVFKGLSETSNCAHWDGELGLSRW
jgi:hypothetical protein